MIYLVRHGETDWNLFKRCNGITDTYLNKTGIGQAEKLAERLREVSIDSCCCSPLSRARRFCEIIYSGSVVYDNRLAEIDCGEFEGMEETADMMGSFLTAIKTGAKGTESMGAFIKRNCDLCYDVVKEHGTKNVLIVTHAANARVINYYFKGKPEGYDFTKGVVEIGGLITL